MAIRSSGPDKGPSRTVRKGLKTGVLNVREDDFSGLDQENYGTGTRSFSSSNQFRTILG